MVGSSKVVVATGALSGVVAVGAVQVARQARV